MKWFLFLVILIAGAAQAQECRTQNLLRPINSPFNKIPVYDQGKAQACYAYAASVLANYHLMKSPAANKVVHPIWLATLSSGMNDSNGLTSGNPLHALQALNSQKNCSYNVVEAELQRWGKNTKLSPTDLVDFLDRFSYRTSMSLKGKSPSTMTEAQYKKIFDSLECPNPVVWSGLTHFLQINDIISTSAFMKQLILRACNINSRPLKLPAAKYTGKLQKAEQTSLALERSLASNDAPVEISYCAQSLYNPSYQGVLRSPSSGHLKPDCNPHASVIVGKKMVNNECNFLLRNSWGSGFNRATKSFKCYCRNKTTGAFADNCTAATHNNGNYTVEGCWIPSGVINQNVFEQLYIPKE